MIGINLAVKNFFRDSQYLDYIVLRPLSHIAPNWELEWNVTKQEYCLEEHSFASLLNKLIIELAEATPSNNYHNYEDELANYVIQKLRWKIKKSGKRWEGADYRAILEQGGFSDINENNLIQAASGRVITSINYAQFHFDKMEESHMEMLAILLTIILYHRHTVFYE